MCRLCFAAMSKMRNELFEKAGEALAKAGAAPTNTQRPPRKRRGYSLPQQPPSKMPLLRGWWPISSCSGE